jgi:hypothetical protein
MFFDKNEIDIKDLYKELQYLNNKLDFIIDQNKIQEILNTPEACRNCSNHPSNGGSGICHCILGQPKVTC